MLVDKLATQLLKVPALQRFKLGRFGQVGDLAVADRAMAALRGRVVIAEVACQPMSQAPIAGEHFKHCMNARHFRGLVVGKVVVQLGAQGLRVKIAAQQAVHLGRLLAFKLDPALFLKVVQRLDHPPTLSTVLLVHGVEIDRRPGPRPAGGVDQRLDELTPLAFKACNQVVRLEHELETVLGEVGIT